MQGTTLSHYSIIERLGEGAMGEVYRARDDRLGRTVAIKVLREALNTDQEQRARFLREAQAASSLQSSNIATIYDIGEQDGSDFIVMEYVDGDVLSKNLESARCRSARRSPSECSSRTRSTKRTGGGSSTATSRAPTSCSTAEVRPRCWTSVWRSSCIRSKRATPPRR
ncbi:MAG TPA: hypothetical protein DCP38_12140 [Acidobacteria bacterium]|nr:hypothetical protein [Acidobacteriota bacterium]HAK56213.1 hypothetical protein [Acidobacteriota bacterium]